METNSEAQNENCC